MPSNVGKSNLSLFALLKDLRAMGVEDHLLLCGLDAIESIFKLVKDVKLLEESSHELSVFLLCGRRSISRCLGFVTHGDEDIPTVHDTSNVNN